MYCIYKLTNKINGKTYIGQHKYVDVNDNYMGSGKILKEAQRKYGLDNFLKEILYKDILTREETDYLEIKTIKEEREKRKSRI